MEDQTPVYGIDKGREKVLKESCTYLIFILEIQAKIESKYSVQREQEAKRWIEEIIGEQFPLDDFADSLKDGVILCK